MVRRLLQCALILIAAFLLVVVYLQFAFQRFLPSDLEIISLLQIETGLSILWRDLHLQKSIPPLAVTYGLNAEWQNKQFVFQADQCDWSFRFIDFLFGKIAVSRIQTKEAMVQYEDLSSHKPFHLTFFNVTLDAKRFNEGSPWHILAGGYLNGKISDNRFFDIEGVFEPKVSSLELRWTNPNRTISGSASWDDMQRDHPAMGGQLRINGYPLKRSQISGHLTTTVSMAGEGLNLGEFAQAMTAEGVFDVRDGEIGWTTWLVQSLSAEISADQAKAVLERLLVNGNLPFHMIQGRFKIARKRLVLDYLNIKHADYYLQFEGGFGFAERDLDTRFKLVLMEPISLKLLESQPELASFKNEAGRIVILANYRSFIPAKDIPFELTR